MPRIKVSSMLTVWHCDIDSTMGAREVFVKQPVKLNSAHMNLWSLIAAANSCKVRSKQQKKKERKEKGERKKELQLQHTIVNLSSG